MKFLVRERVFDIGDDFWVEDESGTRVFLVDGKALRLRRTFELKDTDGNELVVIRKKLASLRSAIRIEHAGKTVATVRRRIVNLLRRKLVVDWKDNPDWEITGDFFGKEYSISDSQGPIAQISRKFLRIRDTYAVDVNTFRQDAGGNPAYVIAVAVCVDEITRGGEKEK